MQRIQWLSTSLDTDNSNSLHRPPSGQQRGTARRCPRRALALVTTMTLAVALAVLPSAAMAAVQITMVQVNEANGTITIHGQDFLGSGTLAVILGQENITTQCQVNSNTEIKCDLSDGFPVAGDYRLTVARGSGQGYNYDLTIGGPQGTYTRIECGPVPRCGCPLGQTLISGGALCGFAALASSYLDAEGAWNARCNDLTIPTINLIILCYAP
jgi:hypothetical protein